MRIQRGGRHRFKETVFKAGNIIHARRQLGDKNQHQFRRHGQYYLFRVSSIPLLLLSVQRD